MHSIFHGWQLAYKDLENAKDKIFCILENGSTTCKLVYYITDKKDKEKTLKSLISDNLYTYKEIKTGNLKIYKVTEDNKVNYIRHNIKIDDIDIKNLDELFIKTYQEYE
jgi:hypothetical protein